MKRKLILLLVLPLILCGCSSKTMTCSGTSEGDKRVTTQEYVLEYKKDTVTNVSQITTHKFDDKETLDIYVKAFDSYVTSLLDVSSQSSGYMLVETKITKDNSYIIKIDAEIEKLTDHHLNKMNMVRDINELKEILETSGLTCK